MTQTMAEHVPQDTTKNDSNSDVQEIGPPLLIQSGRKKNVVGGILESPLTVVSVVAAQETKKCSEDCRVGYF
jgi:hypothetical protein